MLAILPAYRRLQQPCEGSVDGATQAQDITVQRHVWRAPHEVRPLQCPTVDLKQKNMRMKINWSICSWSIWGLLDLFSMREVKFITWWMSEFKLELHSGNVQLRSKLVIMWPWNLVDDLEKQYNNGTSSMNSKWSQESGNAHIGAKFVLTFVTLSLMLGAHYPWCKKTQVLTKHSI